MSACVDDSSGEAAPFEPLSSTHTHALHVSPPLEDFTHDGPSSDLSWSGPVAQHLPDDANAMTLARVAETDPTGRSDLASPAVLPLDVPIELPAVCLPKVCDPPSAQGNDLPESGQIHCHDGHSSAFGDRGAGSDEDSDDSDSRPQHTGKLLKFNAREVCTK